MKIFIRFIFGFLFLAFSSFSYANQSPVTVKMVYGGIHKNEMVVFFQFKSQKNTHIYWKRPGFGGIAPEFNFQKSKNIDHVKIIYPMPQITRKKDLVNYTLNNKGLIAIKFMPLDPALPVQLYGSMTYGFCDTVCHSDQYNFDQKISAQTPDNKKLTKEFFMSVPRLAQTNESMTITGLQSKYQNKELLVSFVINNTKQIDLNQFIYSFDADFEITPPIIRQTGESEFQVSLELFNMYKRPENFELILLNNDQLPIIFKKKLTFEIQKK